MNSHQFRIKNKKSKKEKSVKKDSKKKMKIKKQEKGKVEKDKVKEKKKDKKSESPKRQQGDFENDSIVTNIPRWLNFLLETCSFSIACVWSVTRRSRSAEHVARWSPIASYYQGMYHAN